MRWESWQKKARTGAGNKYKTTLGWGDTQSKLNSNKIHQNKTANVSFEDDLLKYKPTRGVKKTIQGHIPSSNGATTACTATRIIDDESPGWETGDGWILPRELLDNGQGKTSSDMDISDSSSNDEYPLAHTTTTTTIRGQAPHKILRPPIIESTGVIATGVTTRILHKKNKAHRNEKLLQQPVTTGNNGKKLWPTGKWHLKDLPCNMRQCSY
jgi:hypothetical protein